MSNPTTTAEGVALALDVGTVRIGVARSRLDVRLPQPLTTIAYEGIATIQTIASLVRDNQASLLVVGWPRGMDGQSTAQTGFVEEFVAGLKPVLDELKVPVYLQDEALTSRRAEEELSARGKAYSKGDVDALAATYILEDFLRAEESERSLAGSVGVGEADDV